MSDPRDEALRKIGEAIAEFMNDDLGTGAFVLAVVNAMDDYERAAGRGGEKP